ncbi:MAG TPA: hypothetical protein VGB02_02395 [Pyrinomonadaceae bacterium]|jgi:hypothetical protein
MDELFLQNLIDEKFDKYLLFINAGGPYAAIKILGEVYNCISRLDKSKQFQWLERLREEQLSESQIQIVIGELEEDVKTIEHLLSCFEVWIVEELILILGLRMEVDLVIAVLEEIWYQQTNIDLKTIDERILEISMAEDSKRPFKAAVSSIRKNWGMPITNQWLN